MAARSIPIPQSRCVEVWHDTFAEYRHEPGEDCVIAIAVELTHLARASKRSSAALTSWPAPIVAPARRAESSG